MKAWVRKVTLGAVLVAAVLATAGAGYYTLLRDNSGSDLATPTRSAAPGLIRLDASEGSRLLFESEAREAFLPLVSHFETQKSQVYCGPTSIAMVLNALEVPAPSTEAYAPYRLFTQDNLLNERTDPIITVRTIERRGMTLADVAGVLGVYGVSVDIHYASASDIHAFRTQAMDYLQRPGHHVIVNYSRSAMGQEGRGHISPLGAYDADSDRFLVLDVSRYKAPAVWVLTEQLFQAMAEARSATAGSRGFLLIRGPANIDGGGAVSSQK